MNPNTISSKLYEIRHLYDISVTMKTTTINRPVQIHIDNDSILDIDVGAVYIDVVCIGGRIHLCVMLRGVNVYFGKSTR